MKILATGDIHGDSQAVKRLTKMAKDNDVDLVIICGDITFFDQSTENLIGQFKAIDKKVLFIPGNHESMATIDFLSEFYKVRNIHGYSVNYGGVGIFGAGGCTQVGPQSTISEDEMFSLLLRGFEKIRYLDKKIMVTHEHPSGSIMEMDRFDGSKSIKRAIEEFSPHLLICGHIHEAEGIEEKINSTTVLNVGKYGKIIEI